MKVRFDSLDRFEVPKFFVCSPGSQYKSGLLTHVLGCLSDTSDEELILNFNAMSELNFRVNRIKRADPEENTYINMLYNALQSRRLIFVEDLGYFSITDVDDDYSGGVHYKDIRASSIEIEIQNKLVPFIEDGTYKFRDLLEKIVAVLPMWTIGEINEDVARLYRTFQDVSVELNALAFLQENMQDAYECIFEFDCVNRRINVYDQNHYVKETQIHLTKNDVINTLNITNGSEDLYTALNVQGDENLNISPVNPLGTNVIYNFNYYLDWMTPALKERVSAWQELVSSKTASYYDLNLAYYENLTSQSNVNSEIDRINMQIEMYQRCRNNIVAEGSTATVESYNKVIEQNGGVPVGIQNEISDTIAEIDTLLADARSALAAQQQELDNIGSNIETLRESIIAIHDEVAITSYFSLEEYNELSNYIYEGSYVDEYIAVTSLMTYSERFQQMKTLYDRAITRLERVSEPTSEFDMDVENFLFAKEFEEWSNELETGCLINVELEVGDVALLFLSNITVNYEDKTLKMTYGNRFSRFDPKAVFNGVLGDIKKSTNSINYIKEILYPVKEGEFDAMKEAIESSGILTKNAALASANQEIIIDDTGIWGRKLLDNGEYDDKQIKITNQTIVFTDDGWETARTALGNFYFNNPLTGEVEEHYGIIANTLIGNLVLSQEVGIYNTDNSITLDKNGFTLTTDQTGYAESQNVFTIQKKLLDENGNEYYEKQLYIDDDGNVVLNGSISIFAGSGSGNTSIGDIITNVESNDSKIQDLEKELKEQADAIAGLDGVYFFVRYSDNEDGVPMYESPTASTLYMGTCSTNTDVAPTDPSEYTWVKIRSDSTDGTPGLDGTSQYFHIKYSNDGETFTSNNGEELGDWMGTCVTEEEADPTDFDAYEWHKIKGEDGENGKDGTTYFTWIKYADTPTSGMSDNPEGKKYMGLAYNKTESTESANYNDYTWSLIKGEDGTDGTNGINGIDGKTYYTWVKYADDASGANMTNDPAGKEYIGLAYNKDTSTESNDPSDYSWALFKGSDGVNGNDGADGVSCYFYVRYSANANGSSMTTYPTDTTQYMGVCSTTSPTAPTSYSSYTWTRCKGEDGTNGTPGQAGADGRTQYLHIKYSDDGVIFTGCLVSHNISDWESGLIGASGTIESSPQTSATSFLFYVAYKEPIPVVPGQVYSVKTGNTHTVVLRGYDADGNYSQTSTTMTDSESYTIPSGIYYLRVNIRTNYSSFEEISSAFASGEIAPIIYNTEYGIGEALGAYIGTLVDFTEADSTTFSDYTWKKFTEGVDEELSDLRDRIDSKTDDLSTSIENAKNDLQDAIQSESDKLQDEMNSKFDDMNNSVNDQINSASSAIDSKYATIIAQINDQLEAHKADVGQYMQFNDDGLTLGATTSDFKTVIDNQGLYFKQGSTIVSYVNNNQLYIPNAVIENTLILGNFFFSPREDGGVSLTWQE